MLLNSLTLFIRYWYLVSIIRFRSCAKWCSQILSLRLFFYFPLSAQIGICSTLSLLCCRVGHLLASTLLTSNQSDENTISQDPAHEDEGETPSERAHLDSSRDDDQQRQAIVLQNMLLDVLLSLVTTDTLY